MVTSRDVARVAGVAQSTVSYVLSGKRPTSEETRKKVEAAIGQLTYHPNAGARALASRRTRVIGLVIPFIRDLHMNSIMEFISVIATTARSHDYDILLVTEDEGADGIRRVVGQQICDGLILMQVEGEDARVPVVRDLKVPVVLIGIPQDPAGLVCIDADFEMAGRLCVHELSAAGHTRIAVLGWPAEVVKRPINYVNRFLAGVTRAARDCRVGLLELPGGTDRASVARSVRQGVDQTGPVPAFIAPDSGAQELVQQALFSQGLTPGVDVSVIGSTLAVVAERQLVPLTTIDLKPAAVSARAVEILCGLLEAAEYDVNEVLELIPPAIERRASVVGT
ncbi:MAG: transcriptional regulator, LacI family [Micrococcaceae bacterium]|nr:transcriptional regulator, LacI family [Micrococcaceae bacterium]